MIGCHSFGRLQRVAEPRLDGVELLADLVRPGDRLVELRAGRLVADRLADGGGAGVGQRVDELQPRHDVVDAVDLLGREGDLRVLLVAERLADVRDGADQQQADEQELLPDAEEADERHAGRDDRAERNRDDAPGGVQGRRGSHGTGYRPGAIVTLVASANVVQEYRVGQRSQDECSGRDEREGARHGVLR